VKPEGFNAMSDADAREVLTRCLAVPRWAAEVAGGRPYADVDDVVAHAAAAAATLTGEEVETALARHPRIGERPAGAGSDAVLARREQSGVDPSDEPVARRLREGNAEYEAKFDRVFLIRAAGRSAAEILSELRRRLGNDPGTELAEVVGQLGEIAILRLREVFTT
jgi:2-oxo-4-hydroxy-4-carboxy-5-ureidoimidazoline decarboxylase